MCKQCSKQFLYVASLKKHLQNLHPEIFDKVNNGQSLEQFCTVVQKPPTPVPPPAKSQDGKKSISLQKSSEFPKEEIKAMEEQPAPPQPKLVPDVGALLTPYYAPSPVPTVPSVQPEMFQMAYNNPFLYSQQNYGLLCMLQAAKQSETLRQSASSDFWMHKLATSPHSALLQQQSSLSHSVASNDMIGVAQPHTYSVGRPEVACDCRDEQREIKQEPGVAPNIAARIMALPVEPRQPMPQSEHHHIHCEFCGHTTIRHNGHVDYLHDAELHHVSSSGEVYPHKLEVSEFNPDECRPHLQYPWHADGPPADIKEENSAAQGYEDIEKVHEVWCRYLERLGQDPKIKWNMRVCDLEALLN